MIYLTQINPSTRASRNISAAQSSRIDTTDTELQNQYNKLSAQVQHLQEDNTKLQNAMANQSNQGKVLNQGLQDTKLFAGLTEVEGPGVTITLRDSTKPPPVTDSKPEVVAQELNSIIHDDDVLKVVNELWASGAEAISVNNHRVSIGTSFRCVGPTILVDGARIASPVVIRAIGDSETLKGGLNIPGGILDQLRQQDPAMVEIETVKKHVLPAFTGSTQHTLLSVPKVTK
jgi:uncharacterized protein YlxW (UPF0749 family)